MINTTIYLSAGGDLRTSWCLFFHVCSTRAGTAAVGVVGVWASFYSRYVPWRTRPRRFTPCRFAVSLGADVMLAKPLNRYFSFFVPSEVKRTVIYCILQYGWPRIRVAWVFGGASVLQ